MGVNCTMVRPAAPSLPARLNFCLVTFLDRLTYSVEKCLTAAPRADRVRFHVSQQRDDAAQRDNEQQARTRRQARRPLQSLLQRAPLSLSCAYSSDSTCSSDFEKEPLNSFTCYNGECPSGSYGLLVYMQNFHQL